VGKVKLITTDHITGEGLEGARLEISTEHSNGWADLTESEVIELRDELIRACDGECSNENSGLNIPVVSVSACYFTDCLDQYKGECLNGRAWKHCKNRKAER